MNRREFLVAGVAAMVAGRAAFGAVANAAQALGAKATVDALIKAGLKELAR